MASSLPLLAPADHALYGTLFDKSTSSPSGKDIRALLAAGAQPDSWQLGGLFEEVIRPVLVAADLFQPAALKALLAAGAPSEWSPAFPALPMGGMDEALDIKAWGLGTVAKRSGDLVPRLIEGLMGLLVSGWVPRGRAHLASPSLVRRQTRELRAWQACWTHALAASPLPDRVDPATKLSPLERLGRWLVRIDPAMSTNQAWDKPNADGVTPRALVHRVVADLMARQPRQDAELDLEEYPLSLRDECLAQAQAVWLCEDMPATAGAAPTSRPRL